MPDIYMETVVQHKDSKYLICCIEFISICNILDKQTDYI